MEKKPKILLVESLEIISIPSVETIILKSVLFISFTVAGFLMVLPSEQIDGNPVPTIIFKGHPSLFHAFLISVSFAFNGAFTALMMENQSKFARFCGYYSIASMASAISVLMFAIFRQVGQQLQTSSS
ncbi:hypothetical protein PVL29_001113 [Vitis rotundifolia]|uniref:Uncharacterized protein n=1 Tax=Vitis rotundifolia TaxID=103349 RepID=A0AA39ALZ7_VITRO|nr:hypothetical protein PVL29_001113 [Vitis rotundifolia]